MTLGEGIFYSTLIICGLPMVFFVGLSFAYVMKSTAEIRKEKGGRHARN